ELRGVSGSVATFVAATAAIMAGLVGLGLHYRRENERRLRAETDEPEPDPQPRIHRRAPCKIELPLFDKLTKAVRALKQRAQEKQWEPDWAEHERHANRAE